MPDGPRDGNDDYVDHIHEDEDPNPTHGANTEDEKLEVFGGEDDHLPAA